MNPTGISPEKLKAAVRTIPDFPIPGIRFRDITTILQNGSTFHGAVDLLHEKARTFRFNKILGVEARGYIFASALADRTRCGLVIVRKKGKLPAATLAVEYALEYGTAVLEIHADAVTAADRVLIVDDLLATGGTAKAAGELVRKAGGEVAGYLFLIELVDLNGREALRDAPVQTLITFTETE